MILVGNQRAGAKDLALHLLKAENERVEIHEVRGFASTRLLPALNEAYAISRATRCKQFLYSLSLNPPSQESVSKEDFEDAISRAEDALGLGGQPRAVVFHEKNGRKHCHAVWSRINTETMTAIHLSFPKRKLQTVARTLFLKHGWDMPAGLREDGLRDTRNFTLAEWQQAKRVKRDPREIKAVFQECWAGSDNQASFTAALKDCGYTLARGDRRSFVALDYRGEVYSVSKWIGIKAKELRARMTNAEVLPSIQMVRAQIAKDITDRLQEITLDQVVLFETRLTELKERRHQLLLQHADELEQLQERQASHLRKLHARWQSRFRVGIRGLLDRLTGRHGKIKQKIAQGSKVAELHDHQERAKLREQQEQRLSTHDQRNQDLHSKQRKELAEFQQDIDKFRETRNQALRELQRSDRQNSDLSDRSSGQRAPERSR